MTDTERTDLDETRRLLYMALCAPLTKRYNLAGTLVNALAHHQGILDDRDEQGLLGDRSQLILKVCDAVDGRQIESTDWIWDYIDKLTIELSQTDEIESK